MIILVFFLGKGKNMLKGSNKEQRYLDFFTKLGTNDDSTHLIAKAEAFVCALYGKPTLTCVNAVRAENFWDCYKKNKKVAELSHLPPCKTNLRLRLQRANFVLSYYAQHY